LTYLVNKCAKLKSLNCQLKLSKIKKWFLSDDRQAQIEFRNTKVQKPLVVDTTKKLTKKEQKERTTPNRPKATMELIRLVSADPELAERLLKIAKE
jgi:hypothetical protein